MYKSIRYIHVFGSYLPRANILRKVFMKCFNKARVLSHFSVGQFTPRIVNLKLQMKKSFTFWIFRCNENGGNHQKNSKTFHIASWRF